jgi:hypothetical protein
MQMLRKIQKKSLRKMERWINLQPWLEVGRDAAGLHPGSFRNGLKESRSFLQPLHHPGMFSLYC